MVGKCHPELICLFTLCFTIYGTFQYLIHRDSCRRYALFKVDGKGLKVTGGVIASMQVNSLQDCLKQCLDTSNCKSFNYIANNKEGNCQTLSNDKLTGSSFAAAGCNHYEPVAQTVRHHQHRKHAWQHLFVIIWLIADRSVLAIIQESNIL